MNMNINLSKSWVLSIYFLFNELFLLALRLEEVVVPETGVFGESVTLRCDFDIEGDQLLSVKWYKDDYEFFSYSPNRALPSQRFQVPGVFVQSNTTMDRITLTNLTLQSSGNYKCEVSAERPSYRTLSRDGNLTIVVPPYPETPRLNYVPSTVRMGETISGNCTSFRSSPPATLTFYINSQKVDSPEVITYVPEGDNWVRKDELMELYTSTLGLKFTVGNEHFRQGVIKVKCSAKVGNLTKVYSTEVTIKHQNYPDTFTGIGYTQKPNSSSMEAEVSGYIVLLSLFAWITSRKV